MNGLNFFGKEVSREIRNINKIIIHCSDSDIPAHDDISIIRKWHVEERGFIDVGYNFFIKKNGVVQMGRPLYMIGAHCIGQNLSSIGICLSGKTLFSGDQFLSTRQLCNELKITYKIKESAIYPHNHFDNKKTCPNFDIIKLKEYDIIHPYV